MLKKIRFKFLVFALIILLGMLISCSQSSGSGSSSGSSWSTNPITVSITGAGAAETMHVLAGIQVGTEFTGGTSQISSGKSMFKINAMGSSVPYNFSKGTYTIYIFIDMDGNFNSTFYMPNLNDMTYSAPVTVDGTSSDTVITVPYTSFTQNPCSSCDITVNITGVPAGENGKYFYANTTFLTSRGISGIDKGCYGSISAPGPGTVTVTINGINASGTNTFPGGASNTVPLLIMINENGGDPLSFPQQPAAGDKYIYYSTNTLNTLANFTVTIPYASLLTK